MLTEADFRAYLDSFNRCDFDALSRFYAPDVEFVGRAARLEGRDAVVRFYRDVKSRVRETLRLHGIVIGPHAIVADLETELQALEDWPDFPTGPLRRGEVRRSQNFVWYDITGGRFTRVRSAHYRRVEAGAHVSDMVATAGVSMTAPQFAEYIDAFNRGDTAAYSRFYDDDVLLDIAGKRQLRGRQAIADFYGQVRSQTRRTIQVVNVLGEANRLAAELQSEFVALEDIPDFIAGPMKKGGRLFINTIALYELHDGRFVRIRSAELRKMARE